MSSLSKPALINITRMFSVAGSSRSRRVTSRPVSFGHHHVEHREIRQMLLGHLQRLFAVGGGDHLVAGLAQPARDERDEIGIVVGNEHRRLLHGFGDRHQARCSSRVATGTVTVKVEPRPSSLVTRI